MNVYFHVTERLTDLCWESDIIKNARKKRKIISKESIPQQMFTIRKWCPFHIYCEWIRFMESHIHGILHGLCMRSKENEAMSEASIFHSKTLQSLLRASQSSPNITFSHGTGIVIRFWLFVFVSFNIFCSIFSLPFFLFLCIFMWQTTEYLAKERKNENGSYENVNVLFVRFDFCSHFPRRSDSNRKAVLKFR